MKVASNHFWVPLISGQSLSVGLQDYLGYVQLLAGESPCFHF